MTCREALQPKATATVTVPLGPADAALWQRAARELSPVVLAYLGDAFFELLARLRALGEAVEQAAEKWPLDLWQGVRVRGLHRRAASLAGAVGQARLLRAMWGSLSDEELRIVRRARNRPASRRPRGASHDEYRYSTALEALLGYLLLSQQGERAAQLLQQAIAALEGEARGRDASP